MLRLVTPRRLRCEYPYKLVSDSHRNRCSKCPGIVARFRPESLLDYPWNPCSICTGIRILSSENIQKGGIWFDEIGSQLEGTDFGILCLTPGNINAAWILFEAGALSKRVGKAKVVPLLAGLQPTELVPPLSNFNATVLTRDDVFKLVKTLNALQGENRYTDAQLAKSFEKWWGDLELVLKGAEEQIKEGVEKGTAQPKRELSDMVEELLELTRQLVSSQGGRGLSPGALAALTLADLHAHSRARIPPQPNYSPLGGVRDTNTLLAQLTEEAVKTSVLNAVAHARGDITIEGLLDRMRGSFPSPSIINAVNALIASNQISLSTETLLPESIIRAAKAEQLSSPGA